MFFVCLGGALDVWLALNFNYGCTCHAATRGLSPLLGAAQLDLVWRVPSRAIAKACPRSDYGVMSLRQEPSSLSLRAIAGLRA